MENLYFSYLFMLRAVMRASSLLSRFHYTTGMEGDAEAHALMQELVSWCGLGVVWGQDGEVVIVVVGVMGIANTCAGQRQTVPGQRRHTTSCGITPNPPTNPSAAVTLSVLAVTKLTHTHRVFKPSPTTSCHSADHTSQAFPPAASSLPHIIVPSFLSHFNSSSSSLPPSRPLQLSRHEVHAACPLPFDEGRLWKGEGGAQLRAEMQAAFRCACCGGTQGEEKNEIGACVDGGSGTDRVHTQTEEHTHTQCICLVAFFPTSFLHQLAFPPFPPSQPPAPPLPPTGTSHV